MQSSTWAFAIVEMVHLVALALLGGTVLIVDLSMLGVLLRKQQVAEMARTLRPFFLTSLAVMIVSGILLLSEEALKCYFSPAFRLKMLLLVGALAFHFAVHTRLARGAADRTPAIRLAGAVSLLLWLGVGLAGRAIGLV